jgi:predicted TPR repeat methyltransferase
MYLRIGYPDPKKVADFVQLFVSKSNEKNSVKILDFACGTGLVGKYLKEYGFS